MRRCKWCNLENPVYIQYHDDEWGVLNLDDKYLFEMLILESFQAGLSWECVLNKRKDFKIAYDNFDIEKIIHYEEEKVKSTWNFINKLWNASRFCLMNIENLKEELGDVLLQVVFHSQIEEEKGNFDLSDVITAISEKMIKTLNFLLSNFSNLNCQNLSYKYFTINKNYVIIRQKERNIWFYGKFMQYSVLFLLYLTSNHKVDF